MKSTTSRTALALVLAAGAAAPALAQFPATPPSREVALRRDSGWIAPPAAGDAAGPQVVWSTAVVVPRSSWLRLSLADTVLSGVPEEGTGAYVRITSLLDGGTQLMNAEHLRQWSQGTAYFNGGGVLIELVAFPGAAHSRVRVVGATAGEVEPGVMDSICGPVDDRVLSFDNRQARHSVGCTSWLFNDTNAQFMTAGHCTTSGTSVMSFKVPLSNPNGSLNQSAPEDQYPVDGVSNQGVNGGIGNDWRYFGVFPNSVTGLMPVQAYNEGTYQIQLPPALAPGQTIRITGYGTVSAPVSPTWNQVQKTHTGPRVTPTAGGAATLEYQPDTTGGNSGSPVIWDNAPGGNNLISIGIHTHAGCANPQGAAGNRGTGLQLAAVQTALNNPLGACRTGRGTPGGDIYAIGDAVNNFGTADATTGNFAKVSFGPGRTQGLAFDPAAGVFYAIDLNPFTNVQRLFTINPSTGAATQVATLSGQPAPVNGLGFSTLGNVLYGVVQATGTRVVINRTTGAVTVDGVSNPGTTIGAIDVNPVDGLLYGIDDASGGSVLVRFTPATGSVQVVGPLGAGATDCNGLAILGDGSMYTINAANDQLLRINPATGAAAVVGPTNGLFGASFGMAGRVSGGGGCYANCDGSTGTPSLTPADFVCFLNRYRNGESYANCDGSTGTPSLTPADFVCFLNAFRAGC